MIRQAEYDKPIQQNQGASSTGPVEPIPTPAAAPVTPAAAPVTPAPRPKQQQARTPSPLSRLTDNRNLTRKPRQESPGWPNWDDAAQRHGRNKPKRAGTPFRNRSTLAPYVHEKPHTTRFEESTDHEATAIKTAPRWIPDRVHNDQHLPADPVAIKRTKPPTDQNEVVFLQPVQKAIRWNVSNDDEEPEPPSYATLRPAAAGLVIQALGQIVSADERRRARESKDHDQRISTSKAEAVKRGYPGILLYDTDLTFTRRDRQKKHVVISTSMAQPSLVTIIPHSNGYAFPTQLPEQQVYHYPYEEVQITAFDKALVDFGRPRSPMTREIGNPADNSIQFKAPKSIIDQINRARAEPPTAIIRRENSQSGTDRARPPPSPPSPLPMLEDIQTVGQVDYDTTQKKSIFTPYPRSAVPPDGDDNSSTSEQVQIGNNPITSYHGFPEQQLNSTSYLDTMDDGSSITYEKDNADQMASLVTAQAVDILLCDHSHDQNLNSIDEDVTEIIVSQAIDATITSLPQIRSDDAIALIRTMASSSCLEFLTSVKAGATSDITSTVVTVDDHYWQAMLLTAAACAIAASLTSGPGSRRLHSLLYSMASLFWDLIGKLLSIIAA